MTHPALILSIGIDRPIAAVASYLAEPRNFPAWASGLAGGLTPLNSGENEWLGATAQGPVSIRFSPANPFGVADHWVTLADGGIVYVPLRAVANGDGSEVALTLFQLPGMDEARFQADAAWVRRDLATLKRLLEAPAQGKT